MSKKLEKVYEFDARDFNSGKLIEAIRQIKQKYDIVEDNGNRKKVREIEADWVDDSTYQIKVFTVKRNKWKDSLRVREQGASRKEVLRNRDMVRDVNQAVRDNSFREDLRYGNYQSAKRYNPNTRYGNDWSR